MNPYQEIIGYLSKCVTACETCYTACLDEKKVEPLTKCIKLTNDCADICSLGVQLLAKKSELSESFIGLCVDICSKCVDECEKHDHEHCKKCAETCRRCEKICKSFLDNRRQAALNT